MVAAAEWGAGRVREFVINGIDGAWLDDDEKRRMRAAFERELDELDRGLATTSASSTSPSSLAGRCSSARRRSIVWSA